MKTAENLAKAIRSVILFNSNVNFYEINKSIKVIKVKTPKLLSYMTFYS